MRIFQQTAPPRRQARLVINRHAAWYTWSPEFRRVCHALQKQVGGLKEPRLVNLLGGKPYDYTFSFGGEHSPLGDGPLAADLRAFAADLLDLDVPGHIMLFDRLLDEHFDGSGLHFLFAYFRDALAELTGEPMGALYTPLSERQGEFPLHADLYIPELLFNVFENVPDDSSGASLFLSIATFKKLLRTVKTLPESTRQKFTAFLEGVHDEDHYQAFYQLLYTGEREWGDELERRMSFNKLRIKMDYGQGYLINDRVWLHGRECPSGQISVRRLHRLIFNTRGLRDAARRRLPSPHTA